MSRSYRERLARAKVGDVAVVTKKTAAAGPAL